MVQGDNDATYSCSVALSLLLCYPADSHRPDAKSPAGVNVFCKDSAVAKVGDQVVDNYKFEDSAGIGGEVDQHVLVLSM